MHFFHNLTKRKVLAVLLIIIVISIGSFGYDVRKIQAALLSSASVQLSDPRPGQTNVSYTITFTTTATTVECIDIIFADSTGHIVLSTNPSTTAPAGMTTTSSSTTGSGFSGSNYNNSHWSLYHGTNAILQWEYATGEGGGGVLTATASAITNPTAGTFYAQVATYSTLSTHTCSGLVDTSNVMALATTGGVTTTVSVDPTISFSVAGSSGSINGGPTSNAITTASSIAFGSVAAGGSATSAAQLLTYSTNATHGVNIYIRDTQQLTDPATDTIRDQSGTWNVPTSFDGSTSQSSFGFTTNSTTVALGTGNANKWAGLTQGNEPIDEQTSPQNGTTLSVEYQLELKNTQPPGIYTNVITYTATPVY